MLTKIGTAAGATVICAAVMSGLVTWWSKTPNALYQNRFYVHYNANYRKVPFAGGFLNGPGQPVIPVNQQDNYLTITGIS